MANFYYFAPEFTSIEHLAPQLAVEQPFIARPDGSYLQLEYRAGDVIPWAVTRYCLPAASINGAIVCGSGAEYPLDDRDSLCPQCGKQDCTCQSDWANGILEASKIKGGDQ